MHASLHRTGLIVVGVLLALSGCSTLKQVAGDQAGQLASKGADSREKDKQDEEREEKKGGSASELKSSVEYKPAGGPEDEGGATAQADAAPEADQHPIDARRPNIKWDAMPMDDSRSPYEYEPRNPKVEDGWELTAFNKFEPGLEEQELGTYLVVIRIFDGDGEVFTEHACSYELESTNGFSFELVPDPLSVTSKDHTRSWTPKYVRAFAELPPGEHPFSVKTFLVDPETEEARYVGRGEFRYIRKEDSEFDPEAYAEKLIKGYERDPEAERKAEIERLGGIEAVRAMDRKAMQKREARMASENAAKYYSVTLKNDCNKSLTVQASNGKTLILDGKGTGRLQVMRGQSAKLNPGPRVTEADEGKTVTVCR